LFYCTVFAKESCRFRDYNLWLLKRPRVIPFQNSPSLPIHGPVLMGLHDPWDNPVSVKPHRHNATKQINRYSFKGSPIVNFHCFHGHVHFSACSVGSGIRGKCLNGRSGLVLMNELKARGLVRRKDKYSTVGKRCRLRSMHISPMLHSAGWRGRWMAAQASGDIASSPPPFRPPARHLRASSKSPPRICTIAKDIYKCLQPCAFPIEKKQMFVFRSNRRKCICPNVTMDQNVWTTKAKDFSAEYLTRDIGSEREIFEKGRLLM